MPAPDDTVPKAGASQQVQTSERPDGSLQLQSTKETMRASDIKDSDGIKQSNTKLANALVEHASQEQPEGSTDDTFNMYGPDRISSSLEQANHSDDEEDDDDSAESVAFRKTFVDFCTSQELLENLAKKGITDFTCLQEKSVPNIFRGLDSILIGSSGTGKTIAAVVALLDKLADTSDGDGPVGLILASQLHLEKLNTMIHKFMPNIVTFRISGDLLWPGDVKKLSSEVKVLLAEPRHLCKFLDLHKTIVETVSMIVVDSLDNLIFQRQEDDLRRCLYQLGPSCFHQTIMTCRLSPLIDLGVVQHLAQGMCPNILENFDLSRLPSTLDQTVKVMPEKDAFLEIGQLLDHSPPRSKILIVVGNMQLIEDILEVLARKGLGACGVLHHDHNEDWRDSVLQDFNDGTSHVLIATDVAAMDLYSKDIEDVVILGSPSNADEYAWLCSRAGWPGGYGRALTLVPPAQLTTFKEVYEELQHMNLPAPHIVHLSKADQDTEPPSNQGDSGDDKSTQKAVENATVPPSNARSMDQSSQRGEEGEKDALAAFVKDTAMPKKESGWGPLPERVQSADISTTPTTDPCSGNADQANHKEHVQESKETSGVPEWTAQVVECIPGSKSVAP